MNLKENVKWDYGTALGGTIGEKLDAFAAYVMDLARTKRSLSVVCCPALQDHFPKEATSHFLMRPFTAKINHEDGEITIEIDNAPWCDKPIGVTHEEVKHIEKACPKMIIRDEDELKLAINHVRSKIGDEWRIESTDIAPANQTTCGKYRIHIYKPISEITEYETLRARRFFALEGSCFVDGHVSFFKVLSDSSWRHILVPIEKIDELNPKEFLSIDKMEWL